MRLFVNHLTHVDFSFLHPSRGLVGETWQVSVELRGDLDDQGMVVDFGKVKKAIKQWLDKQVDHRLLVPADSSCLSRTISNDQHQLTWEYQGHTIKTRCPEQAVTYIDCDVITADALAAWCMTQLQQLFPNSVQSLHISFTPEHIEGPYYHYSHGLKKHDGNCQRIAHGHRSRILIWRDGELSFEDMRIWANRWQDIYIGTKEDLAETKNKQNTGFSYQSQQGEFFLELPTSQCYLIDTDSTIEFIAQHLANELQRNQPDHHFTVKAFEGIEKGAIAEA